MTPGTGLDRTLVALADPTRRRVVDLPRKKPRRGGDLAAAIAISPPRRRRHPRVLRTSGLIEPRGLEHNGRISMYRLRPERLAAL